MGVPLLQVPGIFCSYKYTKFVVKGYLEYCTSTVQSRHNHLDPFIFIHLMLNLISSSCSRWIKKSPGKWATIEVPRISRVLALLLWLPSIRNMGLLSADGRDQIIGLEANCHMTGR